MSLLDEIDQRIAANKAWAGRFGPESPIALTIKSITELLERVRAMENLRIQLTEDVKEPWVPKDNEFALCWHDNTWKRAYWYQRKDGKKGYWIENVFADESQWLNIPTIWMPLPPAP